MDLKLKKHDWHTVVMILCFVYGGISLVSFFTQFATFVEFSVQNPPAFAGNFTANASFNGPSPPVEPPLAPPERLNATYHRPRPFNPRINTMFYINTTLSLLGAVVSLLAGFSLLSLLRKKERKELTREVLNTMTTPEEKLIIRELEENGGEMTQSELVRHTNLSKVKIHRVVKRLESLGILAKYPYGMTNKIKLHGNIYKEKAE